MNRIFRVIWSNVTQSWVAVSELTKAHKKAGKAKKLAVNSIVAAVGLGGAAMNAAALEIYQDGSSITNNKGTQHIMVGPNAGTYSSTSLGNNTIAIGQHARVGWDGTNNLAADNHPAVESPYEEGANKTVSQSIAIGGGNQPNEGAWAQGDQSIAIGANVHARGNSSIAIGGDDVDKVANKRINYTASDGTVKNNTVLEVMKELTGVNILSPQYNNTVADGAAVALGVKAESADISVAVGTAARAQKTNTVAIGAGALVDLDNAVAIGGGSQAGTNNPGSKQEKTTIEGVEYKWSGGTNVLEGDIVSFGAKGFERQLKNIAAGAVNEESTDGINGSQLYSVAKKIVTHDYLKYAGDDAQTDATKEITKSLNGHKLEIVGGADKSKLSDNNIGVNNVGGKLKVQLSKELTGLTSAAFDGGVNIGPTGINAGNKKVAGVADGTDNNDAVNFGQLTAAVTNINNAITNIPNIKYFSVNSEETGNRNNTGATGANAIAIGPNAATAAAGSVVIGMNAKMDGVTPGASANNNARNGENTVVIGTNAKSSVRDSVVIGVGANTHLESGAPQPYPEVVAIGKNARVPGSQSVAIGSESVATRHQAVALGYKASGAGNSGVAVGREASTRSNRAVAVGFNADANDVAAIALGASAQSNSAGSMALGVAAQTYSANAMAAGTHSRAYGNSSIAMGNTAYSTGNSGIAMGNAAQSFANNAMAMGNGAYSSNTSSNSITLGVNAQTTLDSTVAIGNAAKGFANSAVTIGRDSIVTGTNSVAIGRNAAAGLSATQEAAYKTANENFVKAEQDYYKALTAYSDAYKKIIDGNLITTSGEPLNPFTQADEIAANAEARTALLAVSGVTAAGRTNAVSALDRVAATDNTNAQVQALKALAEKAKEEKTKLDAAQAARNAASGYNTATNAVAMGNEAKAQGKNTTALGASSTANIEDGVALGSNSTTTVNKGVEGFDASQQFAAGDTRVNNYAALTGNTGNARTSTLAGVSVGNATNTRQINHLAAGTADTDAVNVAQLKSVNLGFSGNEGKGDVRLYDQRVAVVGKDVNLIKTTATDKKIEIEAVTKNVTVNSNTGAVTAPTTNGLVTATDLADSLSKMGWTLASDEVAGKGNHTGDTSSLVKTGETVKFVAGEHVSIHQSGKEITISMKDAVTNINLNQKLEAAFVDSDNTRFVTDATDPTNPKLSFDLKPDVSVNSVTIKPTTPGATDYGTSIQNGKVTGLVDHLTPTTTTENAAPSLTNDQKKEAATVGDVLNAGWNLKGNGTAADFVQPYDTVDFVNGDGTEVSVESTDNKTSTVKVKVKAADDTLSVDSTGVKVNTGKFAPVTADDATTNQKPGQIAAAPNDAAKIATVGDVATAINAAAWNAIAAKTTDGENGGTVASQAVKAGDTVTFEADKNIKISQEAGKFTFATKDNVSFNTVQVGASNEFADKDGNRLVQVDGQYYKEGDVTNGVANPGAEAVDAGDVVNVNPVNMKTEAAKPADNNGTEAKDQPTTALNISSGTGNDARPTQLTGVASTLNTTKVPTNPNGTATPEEKQPSLINLNGTTENPVNKNAAATVGDLQNMGWIVSATGNSYLDTVKNANKVDFKGEGLATVTGKTLPDGTREITVSVKTGEVVKSNEFKAPNGDNLVKVGNDYYNQADIDPTTGAPKAGTNPAYTTVKGNVYAADQVQNGNLVDGAQAANVTNNGAGLVRGNQVADAIQESGWNIGKEDASKVTAKFETEAKVYDKVNPNDDVRFVDGDGTTVSMVTVDAKDETGAKKATTYVKIDVATAGLSSLDNGQASVTDKAATDALNKANVELAAAQAAAQKSPDDNDAKQKLADAQTAQANAQKAVNDAVDALGNKVATAKDVINAINNAGFTLKTSEIDGGKKVSGTDELINPGKSVEMIAGKNMSVKQEADGKITYATADEVNFTSVTFGENGPKISGTPATAATKDASGNVVPAQPAQLNVNNAKITGVAAGDISPDSTDAVNGAQIYALSRGEVPNVQNNVTTTVTNPDGTTTEQTLNGVIVNKAGDFVLKTYNVQGQKEIITNSVVEAIHNMNEQGIKFFHSNDGVKRTKIERENDFDSSASGKFATAIGSKADASGENAVAIGFGSKVTGKDSISIGTGNQVLANKSGAFGDPSTIETGADGSYVVGNDARIVAGNTDTFVFGNKVTRTAANSVFLGSQSGYVEATLNADGSINEATSTTAGTQALTQQVTGGVLNKYAGGKQGEVVGVVSVGTVGQDSDGNMVQQTRRIQNVAPALLSENSTDAVNGSQLYAVAKGMGDLNNRINKLGKRADAGTASALAASHIPQAYTPGKSLVGVGAGHYQGQSGIAVGMSRISDNGKYIIRFSGTTNSQGKVGVAAGFGYQF